jgi:hypothetical protein
MVRLTFCKATKISGFHSLIFFCMRNHNLFILPKIKKREKTILFASKTDHT